MSMTNVEEDLNWVDYALCVLIEEIQYMCRLWYRNATERKPCQ